jgi:hypothetical protein
VDSGVSLSNKKSPEQGFFLKRMKGLEPSTFCLASRPEGGD